MRKNILINGNNFAWKYWIDIRFFYLYLDFLAILLSKLSLKNVTKFEYRLLNI